MLKYSTLSVKHWHNDVKWILFNPLFRMKNHPIKSFISGILGCQQGKIGKSTWCYLFVILLRYTANEFFLNIWRITYNSMRIKLICNLISFQFNLHIVIISSYLVTSLCSNFYDEDEKQLSAKFLCKFIMSKLYLNSLAYTSI